MMKPHCSLEAKWPSLYSIPTSELWSPILEELMWHSGHLPNSWLEDCNLPYPCQAQEEGRRNIHALCRYAVEEEKRPKKAEAVY